MDERKVILAKVTCCCPKCDKLFDVERYVEQFAPIKAEDCIIICVDCMAKWYKRPTSGYTNKVNNET